MTNVSFRLYSETPTAPLAPTDTFRRGSDMDNDNIAGYDIPVDPMDLLQCDSCQ